MSITLINSHVTLFTADNIYHLDLVNQRVCAYYFMLRLRLDPYPDIYLPDSDIIYQPIEGTQTRHPMAFITPSDVLRLCALFENDEDAREIEQIIKKQVIPFFKRNPILTENKTIITANELPVQNGSQKFHSDLFGDLTVLTHEDGSLWFIGNEVADKLGYSDRSKAIRTHCKGVAEMDTPTKGGMQTVKIIPERDVYRLVMRSKLPDAEKFEEFVVSEILPSIRKTGGFAQTTAPQPTLPTITPPQLANQTDHLRPTKSVNASFLKTSLQEIDAMKLSEDSRQVLKAHLLHEQAGLPLDLMLPVVVDEKLSPAQIGQKLGISAQAVGSIISKLGIRDNQNYCESRLSKSPHCSKEIIVHYYNQQAVNMIEQAFLERKNDEKKN